MTIKKAIVGCTKIPIYRGYFGVVITFGKDNIKNYFSFERDGDIEFAHTFLCGKKIKNMEWTAYVCVFNSKNTHSNITHGTIAHECLHACSMLLDRRGMMHNGETEEAYAYLIDWMVDWVYKLFKKHKIKIY